MWTLDIFWRVPSCMLVREGKAASAGSWPRLRRAVADGYLGWADRTAARPSDEDPAARGRCFPGARSGVAGFGIEGPGEHAERGADGVDGRLVPDPAAVG